MKKLFFITILIFAFTVSLANASILQFAVFFEHREYDPKFFIQNGSQEITAFILSDSTLASTVLTVKWDTSSEVLTEDPLYSLIHPSWQLYAAILGAVDITQSGWATPWEGKTYYFYQDDVDDLQ